MLLTIKLILTPILVALVTLVGRRWGSGIGGWLTGLPLTSGPVSLFLALQYGPEFSAKAAIGMIGGIASVGAFCLAYAYVAPKTNWFISVSAGLLAFFLATAFWNSFSLSLLPTFILATALLALILRLIPARPVLSATSQASKWDMLARMLIATVFILLLTGFAANLGAQLSGLLTPFPIFTTVLTVFTHRQLGADAGISFLRGVLLGLFSYACFFLVVGALLLNLGLALTFFLATITALAVNGFSLHLVH